MIKVFLYLKFTSLYAQVNCICIDSVHQIMHRLSILMLVFLSFCWVNHIYVSWTDERRRDFAKKWSEGPFVQLWQGADLHIKAWEVWECEKWRLLRHQGRNSDLSAVAVRRGLRILRRFSRFVRLYVFQCTGNHISNPTQQSLCLWEEEV